MLSTAADVPRAAIPRMQRRDRIPRATIVGFEARLDLLAIWVETGK